MQLPFAAIDAERAITFVINAPPDDAFPLFSAKREMEWDSDWRPVFLIDDTVFVVEDDFGRSTWIMTRYDAHERAVNYVRFTPEHTVGQIWIRVAAMTDTQSRVTVTYRLTALSARGNTFVTRWREEFPRKGQVWADVINHYLATGKPLGTRYDVSA
jgi:hypothetical protein